MAGRTHPTTVEDGRRSLLSLDYEGTDVDPFTGDLPEPSGAVEEFVLAGMSLDRVRRLVADHAAAAGLDSKRSGDLVVAVNEAVTNTVRHADGIGVLRLWRDGDSVICDVVDHGWIHDPLAGRLPVTTTDDGRSRSLAHPSAVRPGADQVVRDIDHGADAHASLSALRSAAPTRRRRGTACTR